MVIVSYCTGLLLLCIQYVKLFYIIELFAWTIYMKLYGNSINFFITFSNNCSSKQIQLLVTFITFPVDFNNFFINFVNLVIQLYVETNLKRISINIIYCTFFKNYIKYYLTCIRQEKNSHTSVVSLHV